MHSTPVLLQKATLDRFLKHERAADLIALYTFYIYTGNWQKTNQPKATTEYAAKGLGWGVAKLRTVKAILVKMGLIEDLAEMNPHSRKAEGWFIHILHFPKLQNHPLTLPHGGLSHTVDSQEANACSNGKRGIPTKARGSRHASVFEEKKITSSPTRHSWRVHYSAEKLEIIDLYNSVCVPRGWWPINAESRELHEALDTFRDRDLDDFKQMFEEAVNYRDAGEPEYNCPRGNKLIRILWANY